MDAVADMALMFAKIHKKFYTENLESKVLKLVNEDFCELIYEQFNPLNTELNPICHLLALLGAHHIFHVSGLRVKHVQLVVSLTFCYVCTCCCYTHLLITEINDMCLDIFVLYGNRNIDSIERNKKCVQSCGL